MGRISYVNGRYVPHCEAGIAMEDRGYQFSDGVYEVIAFYNRRLLDGEEHLVRLERSLKELEIAMPMSRQAMNLVIRELMDKNTKEQGGLYMQVTRGVARRDHPFPKFCRPAFLMSILSTKNPKPQEVAEGVSVITYPDIRWGRRDIKSVSLLANVLAKQEAAKAKAKEAWLIDQHRGVITEGSASNSYIINTKGELVTHPFGEHILGGITRDMVLEIARKNEIKVVEKPFTLADVHKAAEAFMTSTSSNVLPVTTIDGKPIASGKPGPITMKLLELYKKHIKQETGYDA